MGGTITAESVINEGSDFMFTVNLIMGEQKPEKQTIAQIADSRNFNILIVDNNSEAGKVFSNILNNYNFKNKVAQTFDDAVSLISEETFDVIFIDFNLNGVSGDEIIDELNNRFPGNRLNIVFLSQIKSSIEVIKLQKTKNYDFITKPILLNKIQKYFNKKYGSVNVSIPKEIKSVGTTISKQATILVAEDQIINMKIITQLLQKKGWEVIAAENGKIAVELFEQNQSTIDIILMDVQMPEMDGFMATECIRNIEQQSGKHTPILAMTAFAMKGDKEKCLEAGMDYYISKPINPSNLYEVIENYINE
jgi:CheY-like chemotaxis protein